MQNPKELIFRSIFLFSDTGKLTYSQRFSLVEANVQNKSSIAANDQNIENFFKEKILPYANEEGNNVFKIHDNTILVVIPTKSFFIAVIPLILSSDYENHILAGSLYFLSYFETIIRSTLRSLLPDSPKIEFASLKQIINLVLPFGSPVIHDQYLISQLTSRVELSRFNAGYNKVGDVAVPSWKSTLQYPVQQLDFTIKEVIIASIEKEKIYYKAFGSLQVSASVSLLPTVSIRFTNPDSMSNIQTQFSIKNYSKEKIEFVPPTGISQLLAWEIPVSVDKMPVFGNYRYKIDGSKIDYCLKVMVNSPVITTTIHLEFNDCGALIKQNYPKIIGQLKQSRTTTILVFDVQQSNEETEISGTFFFDKEVPQQQLCAYCSFKCHQKSFTGNSIRKDDIVINPNSHVNINTSANFSSESRKYVIWGDQY